MTIKRVPLASLVEDMDIYPRHAVDSSHVSDLARAIRAGATLPLPLVEAGTGRIVDGVHRARAHAKVLGPTGEIDVDEKSFPDEVTLLMEAIARNAAHGRKLDQMDRTRSILMLERLGVQTVEIAATLHVTEERVEQLRCRVAIVDEEPQAVKAILWPRDSDRPRRVTRQQFETQKSSQGWRPSQVIGQLIRELRDHVIDLDDPGLCAKLWGLHDEIEAQVPRSEQRTA
jgi:ParB-like chromosome segregation protein Spo0J